MKNIEIELTYLASKIPAEISGVAPRRITDIYIPEDSEYPAVRLRQKGDEYMITKKATVKAGDFSSHVEETIILERNEFQALRAASNRTVEKDRYRVTIDGYPADVDVFLGPLAGMVLLDFEFSSGHSKEAFVMPDCCLADVTQERFVMGGQLAGKTYADIEHNLERFAYKKLPSPEASATVA